MTYACSPGNVAAASPMEIAPEKCYIWVRGNNH